MMKYYLFLILCAAAEASTTCKLQTSKNGATNTGVAVLNDNSITKKVTIGHPITKMAQTDGATNMNYLDTNSVVPGTGFVTAWDTYVGKIGTQELIVWRYVGHTYRVICKYAVAPTQTGPFHLDVPAGDPCEAEKGDFLGWHDDGAGVISFSTGTSGSVMDLSGEPPPVGGTISGFGATGDHRTYAIAATIIPPPNATSSCGSVAAGEAAVALVTNASASGGFAVAIGNGANATGLGASAIGWSTLAGNRVATALGEGTYAFGAWATATGLNTIANCASPNNQTVVGACVSMGSHITNNENEALTLSGVYYGHDYRFNSGDARLLANVTDADTAKMLKDVNRLRVVEHSPAPNLCKHRARDPAACAQDRAVGLVAQEVAKVVPSAVVSGTSLSLVDAAKIDGVKRHTRPPVLEHVPNVQALDVRTLLAQQIGAIQALSQRLEAQAAEIRALRAELRGR